MTLAHGTKAMAIGMTWQSMETFLRRIGIGVFELLFPLSLATLSPPTHFSFIPAHIPAIFFLFNPPGPEPKPSSETASVTVEPNDPPAPASTSGPSAPAPQQETTSSRSKIYF